VAAAIDAGVDLNRASELGETAVLLAVANGHDDVARSLIIAGGRARPLDGTKEEIHATGTAALLTGRMLRDFDSDRALASYAVAAEYLQRASNLYEESANAIDEEIRSAEIEQLSKQIAATMLVAIQDALQRQQARIHERQLSEIGALRISQETRSGIRGYHYALDRLESGSKNPTVAREPPLLSAAAPSESVTIAEAKRLSDAYRSLAAESLARSKEALAEREALVMTKR
jgi:ankyrin repeat protein